LMKRPVGHGLHVEAPGPSWKKPRAQLSDPEAPGEATNDPGRAASHAKDPAATAKVPDVQLEHVVLTASANLPGSHALHVMEPGMDENRPRAQFKQATLAVEDTNRPSEQGRQSNDPEDG